MLPSRRGVDVIDGQVQTPLVRNSKLVPMGSAILRRFESNFPFQVDVPCSKEVVIRIGVKSSDSGHAKFRVVSDDLVRRLLLRVQRKNAPIFLFEFMLRCADAETVVMQAFPIFPVSKFCIVSIFMGGGEYRSYGHYKKCLYDTGH